MAEGDLPQSRVERLNARIRNNPFVAIAIVVGTIVIAVASFTDAATKIVAAVSKQSPAAARTALGQMALPFTPEAFIGSVATGDLTAVKLFITAGMDPNASTQEDGSAIRVAAFKGHAQIVTLLLGAGAKLVDNEGHSAALAAAAAAGNDEILHTLLDRNPGTVALDDAFVAASRRRAGDKARHYDAMRLLASKGAEVGKVAPYVFADLWSRGIGDADSAETTTLLLDLGADVDGVESSAGGPVPTMTPLMGAASQGYVATAAMLIARGAKLDERYDPASGPSGRTALMIAADNRSGDVVELLVAKGANTELKDGAGENALSLATGMRDARTIDALLPKTQDLEARDSFGRTPLMVLATGLMWPDGMIAEYPAQIQALLNRGARVNEKNRIGETALMNAAENGSTAIVRALLDKGARAGDKDADGLRAIDHARKCKDPAKTAEVIRLLQKAGASA
jgi:ankyrin repeat protein